MHTGRQQSSHEARRPWHAGSNIHLTVHGTIHLPDVDNVGLVVLHGLDLLLDVEVEAGAALEGHRPPCWLLSCLERRQRWREEKDRERREGGRERGREWGREITVNGFDEDLIMLELALEGPMGSDYSVTSYWLLTTIPTTHEECFSTITGSCRIRTRLNYLLSKKSVFMHG